MPEGDTIRRLANRLNARHAGATIEKSAFHHPRLASASLNGFKLLGFDAYGKHLLARFDNCQSLHTHLRLRGQVVLGWPRQIPAWRRQFALKTDRGWVVGLDLAVLDLLPTEKEAELLGYLGPDVCGSYDQQEAVARLRRASDLPIGAALLDQTIVCGLGNIYAVETPFIAGVSPLTNVGELDRPDALLSIAVGLIRTNAWFGPQNTTGRRRESSDHWVLNSRIKHCPRCGAKLTRLAETETTWRRRTALCPDCQPESKGIVDLQRAARLLSLHPCRRVVDLAAGTLIAETSRPAATRLNRQNVRRL